MKPQSEPVPRRMLVFFRWFCHPDFREEIEGDLTEQFYQMAESEGVAFARRYFNRQVLLLFRPAIIGNAYHLINKNPKIMNTHNKRLPLILSAIPALLMVPFVAMQFTNSVQWSTGDFIIMAVLLLATGLGCEFILCRVRSTRGRLLACATVVLFFLLIWAALAVGL